MDLPMKFGPWTLRRAAWSGVGLVVEGLDGDAAAPADYVEDILLAAAHREAFFTLVDRVGLVVCKGVRSDNAALRHVRGRSSRGRLSQGEFFHHDGCTGPVKPRVVEIRCPYQDYERYTSTAIAPFPEVVDAMLLELPAILRTGIGDTSGDPDLLQGTISRAVRRAMSPEEQRAYLRRVDLRVGAYREPWEMGETRFIANANTGRTMQHRRAYLEPHTGQRPNGRLLKRWPAEAGDAIDAEACEL